MLPERRFSRRIESRRGQRALLVKQPPQFLLRRRRVRRFARSDRSRSVSRTGYRCRSEGLRSVALDSHFLSLSPQISDLGGLRGVSSSTIILDTACIPLSNFSFLISAFLPRYSSSAFFIIPFVALKAVTFASYARDAAISSVISSTRSTLGSVTIPFSSASG